MVCVAFENENTWLKALNENKVEEFHRAYEAAVENVKKDFGQRHPIYIGGETKFCKEEFPDTCPFDTRIVLGYFQKAGREDASDAVREAKKAFETWGRTSFKERIRIFRRTADLISANKFELAALMSFENGKNRLEAIGDVDETIDLIRYYCLQMEENHGFERETCQAYPDERSKSVLKPYGVWGVIPPFNFPLAITAGMNSGVMIAGNTAVLKPASDTPFMALRFYDLLTEAGLAPGVLNYLTGPGETVGREIIENPEVSGIAFTGSLDVGSSSYKTFSQDSPKPFIAEMGSKNPAIVTAKADLDKAAEGVMKAAFGYSGQKCSACSRVYVERAVKDEFVKRLLEKTRGLKVGDPTRREVFIGPVINKRAWENFQKYAELAKKDGKVIFGGRALSEGAFKHGFFVEPTIVDGLPKDHRLFSEELFVPILAVATVDSLDEAIRLSNSTDYGLTAGIYSEDERQVREFMDRMEFGVLYANRRKSATTGAMTGAQPFTGWKSSGSSGKGAGGPYYIQQFMREQSQTIAE